MIHIPWDLDFLGQSDPNASLTQNSELNKFLSNIAFRRAYWGHVLDVLNKSFNDAFLTKWATHYSRFGVSMTGSLTYLRNRAIYARNQVSTAVPSVAFGLTTAGPLTVATPTADIAGRGWVNVAAIRVAGEDSPLPVTWTAANAWSVKLPLRGGTHTYVLEAVDPDGAVLGTSSITVTATGGPFPAGPGSLVVSELNYNPPEDDDLTEFVELLNVTGDSLDLSGCHFDEVDGEGIAYTFPAGLVLPPAGRTLVVRDRDAMAARYGGALAMSPGVFTGALSNGGERLVLFASNGQEILRFTYSDRIASTDGGGRTLTRAWNATAPSTEDFSWRESVAQYGSPGGTDGSVFAGVAAADADGDGFNALVEFAFGTSDTNPASIPGAPFLGFDTDGTAVVTWPLRPDVEGITATTEVSSALAPETWIPYDGQSGPGHQFFRLRLSVP